MWFTAKAWADRVCVESPRWQLSCARDTYHEPGHLLVTVEARIGEIEALRAMMAQDKTERVRWATQSHFDGRSTTALASANLAEKGARSGGWLGVALGLSLGFSV